jgi:hypothetical protein
LLLEHLVESETSHPIKEHLKAKEEELWKHKYFTMQNYNLLQKIPLTKRNPKSFKIL